ncbi:MAG: hemolysin family protein [Anaerolineaceae bacterium]
MTDLLWLILALTLGIVFDLVSSATKSAFTHVRLPYLINIHEKGEQKVERTLNLLEKAGMRTALRLALIFSHFLVAGSAMLLLKLLFPALTLGYILLILIALMFVVSVIEFMLERWVLNDPERAALQWSGMAALINFLFIPFTKVMMTILGDKAEKVTLSVTDEALRNWVTEDQPESTLEQNEREMIYSIFHFSDTMAKDIMVPRMDLLSLDVNTTISDARQSFISAGHSRVPIYDDTIDNIVGLLYAKDLLSVVDGQDTIANQKRLLRQAYFVPETKKVDELLAEMKKGGIHMALVVDEYGGVAGAVTLEDIVEEIVGEIKDEYDQLEEQLYQKLGEDEYLFQGRTTISEFNEIVGSKLSDEHADTLGGLIYGELGRVPQAGETVVLNGVQFTAEEVVSRRIKKVKAKLNLSAAELLESEDPLVD